MLSTLALLMVANTQAAPNTVSLEVGHLHNSESNFRSFSDASGLSTTGVGYSRDLGERISLVGSYQFGTTGKENFFSYDDEDGGSSGDVPGSDEGFVAAFQAHHITAGARYNALEREWLKPYASARLTGLIGRILLDDEVGDGESSAAHNDNINQIAATSMTPGAQVALGTGAEFSLGSQGLLVRSEVELGYAYALEMGFDDLGSLQFSGVHFRMGIGVAF